jgi:cytochrome c oxidase cbb3-type subunit 3
MIRPASLALLCLALFATACQREERNTRPDPSLGNGDQVVPVTTLAPGGERPSASDAKAAEFEANAFHLSEGKRLFDWFNCSGCHANGGGGMGPPLMDDKWIYGSSIENIHATIRDGRPNGMPSFREHVPDDQIWELSAFVRSLSGNAPKSAAPNRNDDMMPHPSENRLPDAATLGKSP